MTLIKQICFWKKEDNYVDFSLLTKGTHNYQVLNTNTEVNTGKEVQRSRWSTKGEEDKQPLSSEHRRWSLKSGQGIKSILKQNKQKAKTDQSVNFRAKGIF